MYLYMHLYMHAHEDYIITYKYICIFLYISIYIYACIMYYSYVVYYTCVELEGATSVVVRLSSHTSRQEVSMIVCNMSADLNTDWLDEANSGNMYISS